MIADSLLLIALDPLKPHPNNPRMVEREDVIAQIEQQLRASVFDPSYAILVRPWNGHYQIVSGHQRVEAARRAGLKQLPAWVREMDDEAAFYELLLSNAQSELSPLERGLHALEATEKGKHGKSIAAYAEQIGRSRQTIQMEIMAARVAAQVASQLAVSELVTKCTNLSEVHAAPSHCWLALVKRLLEGSWGVEDVKREVTVIRQLKPPRHYESLFSLEKLQELRAQGEETEELIQGLVRTIERVLSDLRDGQFQAETYEEAFMKWLLENGPWDGAAIYTEGPRLSALQRQTRQESERKGKPSETGRHFGGMENTDPRGTDRLRYGGNLVASMNNPIVFKQNRNGRRGYFIT